MFTACLAINVLTPEAGPCGVQITDGPAEETSHGCEGASFYPPRAVHCGGDGGGGRAGEGGVQSEEGRELSLSPYMSEKTEAQRGSIMGLTALRGVRD